MQRTPVYELPQATPAPQALDALPSFRIFGNLLGELVQVIPGKGMTGMGFAVDGGVLTGIFLEGYDFNHRGSVFRVGDLIHVAQRFVN